MAPDKLSDPTADGADAQPVIGATPSASSSSSRAGISRKRLVAVDAVIGLTTLMLVVGIFSVWANRLLFSPDNWAKTSTQLLADPNIRPTTANYLVDQLYTNVDVPGLIKSGLPPQLQGLAAPAAGALRNAAVQAVDLALTRPRVQNLWAQANRAADQAFIAIVNGGGKRVGINQGVVTLNLGAILDNVASRLGLPSNLSSKLPANIATLTLFKSDQLNFIQKAGKAIQGLALWLTILVPILYALAIALARGHRRRTLMTVGFAGVLGGIVVLLGRSILETQLTNSLTDDASLRPTVTAVIAINTQILRQIAAAVVSGGIVLVAAAWFAGPARVATDGRRAISPFLREHAGPTYGIVLAVMLLIFLWNPIHATGTPAGIIVFTVLDLFGAAMLRRETIHEFPDARPGDATQAMRARVRGMRGGRQTADPASTPAAATTAVQLRQLTDLRDQGALTPEEYQSAKSQLLKQ